MTQNHDHPNRRTLLCGGIAALTAFGTDSLLSPVLAADSTQPAPPRESAWSYLPIDPVAVAEKAYSLYPDGSCMYASFRSIVESVGAEHHKKGSAESAQYDAFPWHMMVYGRGGIFEYGSLCGMLNGCAAAISLFIRNQKIAEPMVAELFRFYEEGELPHYVPKKSDFKEITPSVSHSVLCHISCSIWCQESGAEVGSKRRKERCKRLTADLVIKTVSLLNRWYEAAGKNQPCSFAPLSESTGHCYECHQPKGKQKDSSTKMDCSTCHDDLGQDHYPKTQGTPKP